MCSYHVSILVSNKHFILSIAVLVKVVKYQPQSWIHFLVITERVVTYGLVLAVNLFKMQSVIYQM